MSHIQHVEESILTGDLSVLDALWGEGFFSLKVDGAPAVVWGKHPETGKFFVCTKAAFNKKKSRICYTTEDVHTHFGHQEDVADLLFLMLKYLPRTDDILMGDFVGFGRTNVFNNNTLVYVFEEKIEQKLVIAPHTVLTTDGKLCDAVKNPLREILDDTPHVKFIQPTVDRIPPQSTRPSIKVDSINFMSDKEAFVAQQQINALIKSGQEPDEQILNFILGDVHLTNLYLFVQELKYDVMDSLIVHDAPAAFLPDGTRVVGEGFVLWSEKGLFKLVNRPQFSYVNFTQGKFN